jgi:hypothetical protein
MVLWPADATKPATLIIEQAVLIAAIPCVLVGGLVAGVALLFASQRGIRRARLLGWALGLCLLIAILTAALAAGAVTSLLAVLVVLMVEAAELELALKLYRHGGSRPTAS